MGLVTEFRWLPFDSTDENWFFGVVVLGKISKCLNWVLMPFFLLEPTGTALRSEFFPLNDSLFLDSSMVLAISKVEAN